MRNKIVAANWKMNQDEYESKNLTYEILKHLNKTNNPSVYKILCVPFPFLNRISDNGGPTTYVSLVQLHELKQKTGKKYSSVFRAISELVQAEIIIHRYDIDASVYMPHPRLIHTLTRMVS